MMSPVWICLLTIQWSIDLKTRLMSHLVLQLAMVKYIIIIIIYIYIYIYVYNIIFLSTVMLVFVCLFDI